MLSDVEHDARGDVFHGTPAGWQTDPRHNGQRGPHRETPNGRCAKDRLLFRPQGVSMSERLALKDDKTTTGGSILGPSSSWYNEDGRAFALAEDLATCGNCKGSWRVGGTAHNWMDEGQAMVKDLDPVYCPCGKNRVLAERHETDGAKRVRIYLGHRESA